MSSYCRRGLGVQDNKDTVFFPTFPSLAQAISPLNFGYSAAFSTVLSRRIVLATSISEVDTLAKALFHERRQRTNGQGELPYH
jgi:hypothetical protein